MRRLACALTAVLATVGTAITLPNAPAVAAATATPYVFEVENMSLTNFATDTVNHTWNGNAVDNVTYARGVKPAGPAAPARPSAASREPTT